MIQVSIHNLIREKIKNLSLGLISAEVINAAHNPILWKEIENESRHIISSYSQEEVKNQTPINATREAYKILGKDPNRYRPSAEALFRRILKGYPLYKVSVLVDLINLVSLKTGFSIGGFDAHKISGSVTLGVGAKDEPFEAIGRGSLNIEFLPVFRDQIGPIGTPTSDTVRTSIDMDTKKVLLVINNCSASKKPLEEAIDCAADLILRYGSGRDLKTSIIS